MSNKNVTLPQLQKSVFNMKNYVDNSLPDAERFINERIVEVNCDTANPEIHKTYSSGAEQYIYNFDITGKHSNDMGIAVEVIMNNTNYNYITKYNYIMKNYETQTRYNLLSSIIYIVDNSTNKEIGYLSLYLGCSISLDESDSVIKTPNLHDSACIELSRRVTQISDDTNNLFINGFKVKIKFYDISTKYAGDLYDIPYYLSNGEKSGSLQSYRSTVNGLFSQSIGYLNTVNGDYSTAIGQLNKIDTYNSMAYGYRNNLTGGNVIAIGTNNNIGNFHSIALGKDLTIEGLNRETAGNMILGKGGTLANDSLFAISTSLTNPNNGGETLFDTVRYPFEVKKDNTVYLRASNLILETDNDPSEDKHLITKKYVDDKVASLVDSAPETLDTLKELSTALGNDPNFATTMATALGNKVDKVDGKALSTNDLTDELKANYDAAYTHSQSAHFDGDYNSLTNVPTGLATTEYVDNSVASLEDINKRIEILPIENTHYVIQDGVPVSQQNININGIDANVYTFNDEQITVPNDLVLENVKDKFSAICLHSNGLLNAIVTYNDGVNDITKEIELTSSDFYNSEPFIYDENHEFIISFGFDYDINKFYIFSAYLSEDMESPVYYAIKNVTISYNYYTNLIRDNYIQGIDYSKIDNIPSQLNYLADGITKTLSIEEYANLFDNLFVWDANKINDRLDSTSGVKQNVYYDHNIQIKQKDSEGIGFGQYIPSSVMCDYKLFISAGPDVIVKVYNRKYKSLLCEIKDFTYGKYKEVTISDSYSGTDGIFIAFTVKDTVTSFNARTYVDDLVLCKSHGFLNKQEVNDKATKQYVDDSISSVVIPTKVSELTNDSGFITSIPDEYITETELTAKEYIDNTTLESKGYLTEHQDLSSYALKTELHTHDNKIILDAITDAKITEWNSKSTFSGSYNDLTNKPTIPAAYTHPSTHPASMITGLAKVATSGSYTDLTNKPTIPTVSNDLTNALKAKYDAAYTHSQSAHAPSNAQKNSDITKAEIEAKLTGDVTTHTHSQYLTEHQSLDGYATETYVDNKVNESKITRAQIIALNNMFRVCSYINNDISTEYEAFKNAFGIATYSVTNNLTNCINSNRATSISEYSSYNAILSVNENYVLGTPVITMGGVDITDTSYNNGIITIESVTGDITITCTATYVQTGPIIYSITNNLSNCANSNTSTNAEEDSSYSATITPIGDCELSSITVTMNEIDITSSVVSGTTITIPSVTGNIVITAVYTRSDGYVFYKQVAPEDMVCHAISNKYPYYDNRTNRISYVGRNLLIESGYQYMVEFKGNLANVGVQQYNQNVLNAMEAGNNFINTDKNDSGWQTNGYEFTCLTDINGLPAKGIFLTFKNSSNSAVTVDSFVSCKIFRKVV